MKILIVNDYNEQIGGAETYIHSLTDQLLKLGHHVEIYTASDNFKDSFTKRKILISYLNRIFNIRQYFLFKKKLLVFKPDVIHLQNIFNEVSPSILLAKKNIPVLMTIHDYHLVQAVFTQEERNGKKCKIAVCKGCLNCVGLKGMIFEKVKRFIHSLLLNKIDLFIAPSKYMQKIISESSSYKPRLIYYGIDLTKSSKVTSKSSALFSGRLTKGKGVDVLLESVAPIIKKVPNFRLTIAGDGELKEFLVRRARELHISDKVTFLGYLEREAMLECYHKCTLLVVPSTWAETFGLVCVEALSMGRPVVATNVGGIPEIVQDGFNGYLCRPNDTKALSEAIIRIISNESLLQKFSLNAHESIKKFDINRHIDQVVETYKEIATVHRN